MNGRRPSPSWEARLRTGKGLKRGWPGVMQLANHLVRVGMPNSYIEKVLKDDSHEGSRYVHTTSQGRSRPCAEQDRLVRTAIRNARAYQARRSQFRDSGEALLHLHHVTDAANSCPSRWTDKRGATDRAVLRAAIEIAERAHRAEVHLSCADIALRARVSKGTASKAIRRLVASGWLARRAPGTYTLAAEYSIEIPPLPEGRNVNAQGVAFQEDTERSRGVPESDCWRWPALGKTKEKYWRELHVSPISAPMFADAFGVTAATASRHLRGLQAHGLAIKQEGGWVRGRRSPDDVAREYGTAGATDAQRERNRAERAWREKTRGEFQARAGIRREAKRVSSPP